MNATTPTVAAVYLRISSDPTGEQLGVTRQREDCLALCAAHGWTPVEYPDNDKSATTGKERPAYKAMLRDIREGRIGAVVAWDLDRLHRRPIELEEFMALADERHLALATVSGDVDLSSAQGRLVARLKGAVAKHESDHKIDRQRRAARQKAEGGKPNWSVAFGYTPTPDGPVPDPVTAPLVKRAYAAILAGASLADVCALLNDAGAKTTTGRAWRPDTLSPFLRKARNAGLREYKGELVGKASWAPLVDEPTWRATQAVLDAPGRSPGRKSVRRHLLTGVLQCGKPGCTGRLSGGWARSYKTTGRTDPRSISYNCKSCHGILIREDYVRPLLYELVSQRLSRPDAVDLLKSRKHDTLEAEAIRTERTALLGKLDKLARDYAHDLLNARQVKVATDEIQARLDQLTASEIDQERLRVLDGLPLGKPEVGAVIRKLSPDRFRAVLDLLCVVTILPVGKSGKVFQPERVKVDWLQ